METVCGRLEEAESWMEGWIVRESVWVARGSVCGGRGGKVVSDG